MRQLTPAEIAAAQRLGTTADDWSKVCVAEDFRPEQLRQSCLCGTVELGSGAEIIGSAVSNYRIGARTRIEGCTAVQCRRHSAFGNGTAVAAINENGGRTLRICAATSAQTAYMAAVWRHRPQLAEALDTLARRIADDLADTVGTIGADCRITGTRFIREVRIGDRVTIDGASLLENGTLCDDAQIGIDVKAADFIVAEGARVAGGTTLERCFVGESCTLDKNFTATDSLFFANSHCENGEAASVFAGPYTVSHHKASLLIAGIFSFFNAGSASNQSNHLFKSGAVHQAAHLRGCKFASGAYIMAPAVEGPFTMVMGHHVHHHDTSEFPYAYLLEKEGRSHLLPALNLTSYGTVRDIEKWPARDRRTVGRDAIRFEEHNPYLTGLMIRAVNALHELQEQHPEAESYPYKGVVIRSSALQRGIKLYNRAIVASLGAMLERGSADGTCDGSGRWIDMAGLYLPKAEADRIADRIERGELTSLQEIDAAFRRFAERYDDYARDWAVQAYAALLGHAPTADELREAVEAGANARAAMRRTTDADRERDNAPDMAVGYGLDCDTDEERQRDFCNVRGLA